LFVKNIQVDKIIGVMSFRQKHDTLLVFNSMVNGCQNDTGVYHISYQHSGQLLFLSKIDDPCKGRNDMLATQFNYVPDKFSAPRDWLQLDPVTDSIAGISLYKAYKLLKGHPSKPVIVAVIDNGFDMDHEDLKNIFWTNTKEIPANKSMTIKMVMWTMYMDGVSEVIKMELLLKMNNQALHNYMQHGKINMIILTPII
jgi:hypothetical protein